MPFLESLFGGGGMGAGAAGAGPMLSPPPAARPMGMGGMMGGGAPPVSPVPPPKPGMMSRLGNPSWWGSMRGSENLPKIAAGMGMFGQGLSEQAEPEPMPPPPDPREMMNPQAIQMAMQMMQQAQRSGMPPQISGAPGLYRGR